MDWTSHDSVRNAKDCTSNEYTNNLNSKKQSPNKYTELTNLEINVRL